MAAMVRCFPPVEVAVLAGFYVTAVIVAAVELAVQARPHVAFVQAVAFVLEVPVEALAYVAFVDCVAVVEGAVAVASFAEAVYGVAACGASPEGAVPARL